MKQTNIAAQANDIRCPRCGYDQRGIMETWENACDIFGTCSECGLDYEWGNLLNPKRNMPKWCVEYAESTGSLAKTRAFIATVLMMLRPWRFWSELGMHHQPQWRRHVKLAFILMLLLHLIFDLMLGLSVWGYLFQYQGQALGRGTYICEVITNAMLMPFGDQTLGFISVNRGSYPIPTPLEFTMKLLAPRNGMVNETSLFLLLYTMLCPLGFLALPQSRRIAKVRWTHVLRIGVYSLFLVWSYVVLALTCSMADRWWPYVTISLDLPLLTNLIAFFSAFIVIFIWWSFATSRYLKMKHGWGVGLAVCVMSWIATMIIFIYSQLEPKLW